MKRYFLIIAFFCTVFISVLSAQKNQNYSYNHEVYMANMDPVYIKPEKNIAKIVFTNTNTKSKIEIQNKYFDNAGRILKHEKIDKHGNLKSKFTFEYCNDTISNPEKIVIYSTSGKPIKTVIYKRDLREKMTEYTTLNDDNIIIEKNLWFYDLDGKVTKSEKYSKRGEKLKKVWLYSYNSDGKLTEAKLCDGKNKTLHLWEYNCNEEGVKFEKEKDLTQVCNWTKVDDSYFITVYQTFDDKGKIRKYVSKFSSADSVIVESTTFDENDVLLNRFVYDGNYKKNLSSEYFKKGILSYKSVNTYNGDLIKSVEVFTKKGFVGKTEYLYNDKNLLTQINKYDKDNVISNKLVLEYVLR